MRSMKHSIKREQSHARMSFAEFENQRSLAEGESNVRATLKHMKLSFNLILTLVAMLTMAQTAWAATETKTATWYLNAGTSGTTTLEDKWTLLSGEGKRLCYNNSIKDDDNCIQYSRENFKTTYFKGNIISNNGELVFTNIEGTVTKVEMSMFQFYYSGMQMYVGLDKGNNSTLLHLQGNNNDFDYSSTDSDSKVSATFEGSIDVSPSDPLKIMFSGNSESGGNFCFKDGYITVTYEVESQSSQDPGHSFTFNVNGNTLTATCNSTDVNHTCNLTDRKSTLVLDIDDVPYNGQIYIASFNLGDFIENTGLTVVNGGIKYVNRNTGEERANGVYEEGSYTASVTISINDNDYQLSKDFDVYNSKPINNSYRQISLSKNVANKYDIITITFTPRSHELVNTLTVTGATTNKSIGNGITKVDEYTYTFTMPFEEVTIGATFKSSNASLYKYAITTDITGSGAVDYNAEEFLGAGDAITITFMPYLQGNLEAGSVVLEGLTVTGTTTNMSVGNGITDNGNNTYTFTMPGENVTVTAKAYLSADAILSGTINEPIYIKQGNGIQIGCNNKWTYVNDGALPLVIPDGNTLRLAGGTDVKLDLADKNAIACEGDAIVELIPNEVSNDIWIGDRPERNSGKATIKVGPAGKTLTIRVADESTETVHLDVKSISQYDRNCDVIGCDEGGSCGSIVVESGKVESREYFNHSGRAFRTTDGTITFGYKYPNDEIIFDGGSEGTVKIEDGKQFHSHTSYNTKYSGTINLQGINFFDARPDKYTVTFDENGGSDVDNQTVAHGMKATKPATTREGFTFVRWNNGEDAYDFNTVVTSDLTLKAEWNRPITSEGISISVPSQEWTGSELAPVITVTDGETELTLNTDYTVTAPSGPIQDVGDYTYTITGVGNYSGTREATFTIMPKAVGTYGALAVTEDQNGKTATIDASLEATIEITSDVEINQVELQRSFTANQPATVMLPFSLGTGQTVNGGSFYKFSGVTKDGDEWKALFTDVATLKANTPYLFMPSATGQMTFNLNGGTVTLNTTTTGETGSTASNWEFRGTYAKVLWDGSASDPSDLSKTYGFAKGNATIAAGQFVHFAAGAWLKPMRCYLVYNGSTEGGTFQNAPSRTRGAASTEELPQTITVVLLSSSGETTGIGTLDTKTGDITLDGWYTMDGRKLEGKPTKKGLYINNGRKIVIK